jgi:hypothetical protein
MAREVDAWPERPIPLPDKKSRPSAHAALAERTPWSATGFLRARTFSNRTSERDLVQTNQITEEASARRKKGAG